MRIIPGFSVHPLIPNNGGSRRRKPRPDGQPARMAPERIHIVTRPDARLSARAPRRGAPLPAALNALALSMALAFAAAPHAVLAQSAAPVKISIAAQPLDKALLQFGQQTRLQVYFLPEAVRDLKAPAVSAR